MAAHAIGDIESLLQVFGSGDGDEDTEFDETILQLVLPRWRAKTSNVRPASDRAKHR